MGDWNAAQAMELQTWKESISASPISVYEELRDAAELERFIAGHGVEYRRAVDVGVGPLGLGWIAVFGRGSSDDLVGVDPLPRVEASTGSPELDEFVSRLQRRITFAQGRAEDRLLPAESFDLVVCDNVIDHTEQPEQVLAECRRLMRPGGRLVFGVNVFSAVGLVKWRRYTRVRRPDDPNTIMHPHSYGERSAARLLRSSGWTVLAAERGSLSQRVAGRAYRYRALAAPA